MDKEKIKYVLRFVISSIMVSANELLLNEDEREMAINTSLNTLVNILQPEYSLMLLDTLTDFLNDKEVSNEIEKKDLLDEILTNMKEQKNEI